MAGFMKRLFRGAETPAEEMKEAKALKSGKITEKQYVAGERQEGHDGNAPKMARAIKSGKLPPAAYAKKEQAEGMKCGGRAKKMATGGMTAGKAAHAVKEGKRVAKEMEYDYKTGKKSFAGSTAQKDAHAEKEGRKVAKAMEFDFSKGRKMATGGKVDGVAVRGKTKAKQPTMAKEPRRGVVGGVTKMAKGGGIETKGKTKGRMV